MIRPCLLRAVLATYRARHAKIDPELEAAASLIQAMFRGQQYRRHVASELGLGKKVISGAKLFYEGTGGSGSQGRRGGGWQTTLPQKGSRTASVAYMAAKAAGMGRTLTSEQQCVRARVLRVLCRRDGRCAADCYTDCRCI